MRLCLLAPQLPTADPADAVGEHARRLAAAGHDVTLALTDARPAGPHGARLGEARAVAVEDALAAEFDVVVAMAWESTVRLFEVRAGRRAFWVDELAHHRLGRWQAERIAAAIAYDLPVDFLAAGESVGRALREQRPDARVLVTPSGVARELFAIPRHARAGSALRVLVDDRWAPEPQAGAGREAASQAEHPTEVTYLEPGDDAAARAAKYARADVLVMLDPVAGVLRSPLEAAQSGVVPIVAPAADHDDLVAHLSEGIVAEPEDLRGVARWLDRLGSEPELLGSLSAATGRRAAAWPAWDEAAGTMAAALEELVAHEPPVAAQWPVRLMADAMAAVAVFRNDYFALSGQLRSLEGDGTVELVRRVRQKWRQPRFAPARRIVAPLVRAAHRRSRG